MMDCYCEVWRAQFGEGKGTVQRVQVMEIQGQQEGFGEEQRVASPFFPFFLCRSTPAWAWWLAPVPSTHVCRRTDARPNAGLQDSRAGLISLR